MTELSRYDEADGASAAPDDAASRPQDAVNGAPDGQREAIAAPGAPRRRGGSRRGIKNKFTAATREEIVRLGDPFGLLCRIAAGHAVWAAVEPGSAIKKRIRPTLAMRLDAATTLAKKLLPDLKAAELTGANGEPLVPAADEVTPLELSRRIALLLVAGDPTMANRPEVLARHERGPLGLARDVTPKPTAPPGPVLAEGEVLEDDGTIRQVDGSWRVPVEVTR